MSMRNKAFGARLAVVAVAGLAFGVTASWSVGPTGTYTRTVPGAPLAIDAKADIPRGVTLLWLAPAADGGSSITNYVVASTPTSAGCTTPSLTCRVTGLQVGVSYTFTVRAVNAIGQGLESSISAAVVVLAPLPSQPSNLKVKASWTSAELSWVAPADNGGAADVTYIVFKDAKQTGTTTATSYTVASLIPGKKVAITVYAQTDAGQERTGVSLNFLTSDLVVNGKTITFAPFGTPSTAGKGQLSNTPLGKTATLKAVKPAQFKKSGAISTTKWKIGSAVTIAVPSTSQVALALKVGKKSIAIGKASPVGKSGVVVASFKVPKKLVKGDGVLTVTPVKGKVKKSFTFKVKIIK